MKAKKLSAVMKGLSAVTAVLLVLSIVGTQIAETYRTYLNDFLGIESYVTSTSEGGRFQKDYDTIEDMAAAAKDISIRQGEEGTVVMKNDNGVLPLASGKQVALFGVAAYAPYPYSSGDLKAGNAEQRYLSGLSDKIRAVEKQSIAAELETALFVSSAGMVLKLGIASVALTGAVLLVQGRIDVLTLFLFLMAASRMYDPMQGALQNLAAVIAMRTNVGRMNEILDAPLQTGSEQLTNQGCDIVFDHVGFAYNSGETVLRDVSFTAKQGEVTALVGPSGGGKTTVSRLAARFWDYQKGSITVGGMEVSRIDPEKLMSLYSIVFQDVTLFDNTILENIRLGRKGATDEEVLAAAKLANCDEFAEKLPDKWNTNIGENGCALSGGERQRISIARAFLKDAPIILLDEATASLDVENETAIQEALSRLIKNKTVLIIAHLMRTVAGADQVVVLSGGIVAEQGSPAELYARKELYTHMVDLQSASQNWTI